MSRRVVFFVTVFVVLFYFTFILCILKPLHGHGGINRGYHRYMNGFGIQEIPSLNWCKALRLRSPPGLVTALVSFPGSGNTWLRYLLQQATGILTGSIYLDYSLLVHGFLAENVTDGSVLVVKTHVFPPPKADMFNAAVLLIRDPRDAILAEFNRLHKGHIGTAPKSAFRFKRDGKTTDWSLHVSAQLPAWEALCTHWLRFPGPIHVLHYETLVQDTRGTLRPLLAFLNNEVSEKDMDCAIQNREGIYRRRRKHTNFDPFTPQMYREIEASKARVEALVRQYGNRSQVPVN